MPTFSSQPDEFEATMVRAESADASRSASRSGAAGGAPRRRGRPPLMGRAEVIALLRHTAERGALFRVHFEQPALYARARRLWGSWAGALLAAGIDYESVMTDARRRSADTRRQRTRRAGRQR